jgi:hypothetical protein
MSFASFGCGSRLFMGLFAAFPESNLHCLDLGAGPLLIPSSVGGPIETCGHVNVGANWYTRRENVEISTGMGIWLISLLFPAPAIINQCRFSAVAFSAQRLQVALIISPAARLRKPVVNRV